MNIRNTVEMICRTCRASGTQSEMVYGRRMMREGLPYRERQRVRVQCLDCVEEMVAWLLAVHQKMQHRVESGGIRPW